MLLIVGFACGVCPDLFPVFRKQIAYTAENDRISGLTGKNQVILAGSGLFIKCIGDCADISDSGCGFCCTIQILK